MQVVIDVPDNLVDRARDAAQAMHSDVSGVIGSYIQAFLPNALSPFGDARRLKDLTDGEVLELANLQMHPEQDARQSELLFQRQARPLTVIEEIEFSGLMREYEIGMLRKAEGIAEAARRELISLDDGQWQ